MPGLRGMGHRGLAGQGPSGRTGGWRTFVPAVFSGVSLVFAFPFFDYYWLAWFCLVPFFVSLSRMRLKQAFWSSITMGVVYFFGTQYWIYHSIHNFGGMPLVPSLAVVLLLAMYMGLYTGIFGLLFSWQIKDTRMPAMFLAPLFWVTLEYARTYVFTGFPWSSIGYTQYKFTNIIQVADITGVYGVSFLVVAVNGAIADFFIVRDKVRRMPLFSLFPSVTCSLGLAAVLIGAVYYGDYRLQETRPGSEVKVGVIQGNVQQDLKWDPSVSRQVFDTYKSLSRSSRAEGAEFIVWPETAAPFFYGDDKAMTNELKQFASELNSYLLFGSVTVKKGGEQGRRLANSAILLDNQGKQIYSYDKMHMVPFGEYVPLKNLLFFVDKLVVGIGDYVPGDKAELADTPFGSFATLICYEIIFPGLTRSFYQGGGDFIVTITNDAWFGHTTGPYQHFSMAVFRAVENRKPVIRAANSGISGFIDSGGRILRTTRLFERTQLTVPIMTDKTRSFYSKYGDLFMYLCLVITMVIVINPRAKEKTVF